MTTNKLEKWSTTRVFASWSTLGLHLFRWYGLYFLAPSPWWSWRRVAIVSWDRPVHHPSRPLQPPLANQEQHWPTAGWEGGNLCVQGSKCWDSGSSQRACESKCGNGGGKCGNGGSIVGAHRSPFFLDTPALLCSSLELALNDITRNEKLVNSYGFC